MSIIDTTRYSVTCQHCKADTFFCVAEVSDLDDDITEELEAAESSTRREVEAEFAAHIDPADEEWRHMFEIGSAIRRKDLDAVTERLRAMCAALGGNLLEELDRGLVTSMPLFETAHAA